MHTIREAKYVNSLAREAFLKDGKHTPILLLFRGDKAAVIPVETMMDDAMGKDALHDMIRDSIRQFDVSGIALIMEAWMYAADKDSDLVKKLANGDMQVRDLDQKREVLTVNIESDDGLTILFMNPIVRDSSGKPSLSEVQMIEQTAGLFSGFFPCAPVPELAM